MESDAARLVESIDSQVMNLAESVRCASVRSSIKELFCLLEALDANRRWQKLETIWNIPAFNPMWQLKRQSNVNVEGISESVSFDSDEWGVHFDVDVFPDLRYGCRVFIKWSSDGKARSLSEFESKVWIWENLNCVSRFIIGRAIMENANGNKGCFGNWELIPDPEQSTKKDGCYAARNH